MIFRNIYIPLWFRLNHTQVELLEFKEEIYIPLWFRLNDEEWHKIRADKLFTFHYGLD